MIAEDCADSTLGRSIHVTIASRIFEPEPSAASFRLGVLAQTLSELGHDVSVITVNPPKGLAGCADDDARTYRVERAPVFRDQAGYVRGYLPYLSFDAPLFFRLLFRRRADVIVAEPPPTTGFFVRLVSTLRRVPYVYYAADIWADGAAQTGAPKWIMRVVRSIERFAMRGARTVLSVSDSLTSRLAEIGVVDNVLTVGNGIDPRPFCSGAEPDEAYKRVSPPEFVYAGTASEWHGSTVFVEALPIVRTQLPGARIRFIGGGSEFEKIKALASRLDVSDAVTTEPFLPPTELAPILRGSTAALASIVPGNGNESTFPTKLYASTLCGTPAVFAGVGPAVKFLQVEVGGAPLGLPVGLEASEVAQAMLSIATQCRDLEQRKHMVRWGLDNVALSSVAERIARELEEIGGVEREYPGAYS